ncbi:hypothetical protein ACE1B6_18935 [Aerosakkonemataceae cyanobacterium BLCC-F154]|uniref:Uncharacterized protein n=1 Tax=Floridaenema fluviatile BLCC-F154 TaxID=3153640 RepID=A0ABV4YFN1_9CYAN
MRFNGLEKFLRSQFQGKDETKADSDTQEFQEISHRNLLQGGFVTGVAAGKIFEEDNPAIAYTKSGLVTPVIFSLFPLRPLCLCGSIIKGVFIPDLVLKVKCRTK